MTGRRAARRAAATGPEGFPAELAGGPCLEDWADDAEPWAAAHTARRAWGAAVAEWAARVNYPGGAFAARELARARRPWSREYLHATGRGALADYYDGRRADHPGMIPDDAGGDLVASVVWPDSI